MADEMTVYDGMCLWEAFLEACSIGDTRMLRAKEAQGTHSMREFVMSLLPALSNGWAIVQAEWGEDWMCFDWEYCPAFLSACVDWSGHPSLYADWRDHLRTALKEGR